MRGATSKDGKMAGNRQMVDRYDESRGGKAAMKPKGDAMDAGEKDHAEIKDVVAEHGPAHTHIITKDGMGHHSETHHKDGHTHHADHDSLDEAHEHGKEAMGEDDGQDPSDGDEGEMPHEMPRSGGGFMPSGE